ncbi:MAG: sigma-70 family RNA polymerase sigma factor [Bacteroidales bacterium]|nr:sigma-70 family RNA polymerase sigma factor [Bacteroidales bacterium]
MDFFQKNRNTTQESDEDLTGRYLATKDLELLGILYQRYIYLVYGVCLKYFKDREESKDAVMQIFEKLITEIEKHAVGNFRPWLYVMTKHYCLRQLQKKASASKKIKQFYEEKIMESTIDLSPLDEVPEKDMNKALGECIEKLKKEQKACIELFYLKEKCYREVSHELGIPLNKVKSCIQNGKRNLKICLENKNG